MLKIRCSQIGKIIANGKGNNISSGAKTYVEEKIKERLYGTIKNFNSKYTEKGNLLEDDAIQFYAENSEFGLLFKNDEFFENEYFTGTPDIITKDEVIDIKTSWDYFTFPLLDDNLKNKDYYAQLHGYMELTGKRKARLVYVLMDTPDHLDYDNDHISYENVSPKLRIKEFKFEYNDEFMNDIKNKVKGCQEYYNKLLKELEK